MKQGGREGARWVTMAETKPLTSLQLVTEDDSLTSMQDVVKRVRTYWEGLYTEVDGGLHGL
eukprot:2540009-Amphidinium_carterae.1